ncbi:hypothetical protein [Staphylococcus epidermidis]|uniref:hypothetical protein n=1 Tax=Staphylococcus epidermidis TaxID=1282 RepID=UPI0005FB4584|nr:hypothetical protein [Staphylococcus epidermidis]MDU2697043.1 hypothetical protein [Staphylococcus epidermidis]MEB7074589.1 hypothetical protein [Staphylococcus epidermidis]
MKDVKSLNTQFEKHVFILLISAVFISLIICFLFNGLFGFVIEIIFFVILAIHGFIKLKIKKNINLNKVSSFQYYLVEFGFMISLNIYVFCSISTLWLIWSDDFFNYVTVSSFITIIFLENTLPKMIKKGINITHYKVNSNDQQDILEMNRKYELINIIGILLVATIITLTASYRFIILYII